MNKFKCHFCTICNGTGCIDQLPGMGGVNRNINFRLNSDGWEVLRKENPLVFINFIERPVNERIPQIAFAPITGAVENIGFSSEEEYYSSIFSAIHKTGIELCVGDGFPDDKIKFGLQAIKKIQKIDKNTKANFFIKPFQNKKIFEHIEMVLPFAKSIGIDIDSYNIATMQNLVPLEKKSALQLQEIQKFLNSKNIPFVLKGIFDKDGIELVKQVKPDAAYISNHGGRIQTRIGSTAEFLQNHGEELKNYTKKIWVDGGIRTALDVATAMAFGADKILIGRPFVTAYCKNGETGICQKALEFSLLQYAK